MRDDAAIAGVSSVGYFRHTDRSEIALAVKAVAGVASDAGADPKSIDGLITYQHKYDSVRPREVVQALGMRDLKLWLENWLGGPSGQRFLESQWWRLRPRWLRT